MAENFHVKLAPCLITGQVDHCLSVKLGEINGDDGTLGEVYGNFSEAGLQHLQETLRTQRQPVSIPTPEEIRRGNPYGWLVIYEDGTVIQQYDASGHEMPFALVELGQVRDFWIVPTSSTELPAYGLLSDSGFARCPRSGAEIETLPLPWPKGECWEWHYYRRNTITFNQEEHLPPHTLQVLGWRMGTTVCEIAIEADGTWQIYKKEPLDDPRFARQIVTANPVRIIDPLGE